MSDKKEEKAFDPTRFAGKGLDQIDPADLGMPFLKILQDLSPEVKKSDPRHEEMKIEGAEPGDIVFATEKLLFPGREGINVIPLAVKTLYTEWRPRAQGGGFVGYHGLDIVNDDNYIREGNDEQLGGNDLFKTTYLCVLFSGPGEEDWKRAIISFTKTQLAKVRQLNKMILSFRYPDAKEIAPPFFACSYRFSSVAESNNQGSWYGWSIKQNGPIYDENLLSAASEAQDEAVATLPSAKASHTPALPEGEEEAF